MLDLIDIHAIIKLKQGGDSNREIAKKLGYDRKTVAKHWNDYLNNVSKLETTNDVKSIQEAIVTAPKYNSFNRQKRKYNDQIDKLIDFILENEKVKIKELGWSKQSLTNVQIHEMIVESGFDIGLTTISTVVREKRKKAMECFIKQSYNYGDRLEYDFGEIKLKIKGQIERFYIAVLSSPKSNFRWAYLYKSQKKEVFMDSHIRFFDMLGRTYKEVVYDNMRNVVKKFIGKSEKVLNDDLLKLSLYYDFEINVTNCYKGNEKGHVEGAVKFIRNRVFAKRYEFNSFEEAATYLQDQLINLNIDSDIEEEKLYLKKAKPRLNLAIINEVKVSKYSLVTIENNYYSVPEYLVGRNVIAKIYFDTISIYSNNTLVCEHKKVDGLKMFQIDIMHYLNTFLKKPGALKNSHALKSQPKLKSIYDKYYKTKPLEFIELLQNNQKNDIEELLSMFDEVTTSYIDKTFSRNKDENKIVEITRSQINNYNKLLS